MLAHRTGLARHDPIWFFSEISRSSVIGLLKNLEPACDLHQDFQYNNFMYTVAGIIVERLTGQSWEEAMFSRLLKPLEMKNSVTSLGGLQGSSDFSLPHAEIKGVITNIPFRNTFSVNPDGNIELKIEKNNLLASYGKTTTPLYFKSENLFTGQFSELLIYGINSIIDFKFFKDSSSTTIYKVEIPFEGFRSAKPITFIREVSK